MKYLFLVIFFVSIFTQSNAQLQLRGTKDYLYSVAVSNFKNGSVMLESSKKETADGPEMSNGIFCVTLK